MGKALKRYFLHFRENYPLINTGSEKEEEPQYNDETDYQTTHLKVEWFF